MEVKKFSPFSGVFTFIIFHNFPMYKINSAVSLQPGRSYNFSAAAVLSSKIAVNVKYYTRITMLKPEKRTHVNS